MGLNVSVTGSDAPQNETSIAFYAPTGTLMGGANDYRDGDSKVGLYRSIDGEATWSNVVLRLPGNLKVGADPSVDFGANGRGYAGGIGFNRKKGGSDGSVLVWGAPDANFAGNEEPVVVAAGSNDHFHDKPYLAAGKLPGTQDNVYITWTDFTLAGRRFTTGFPIMFSQSTDSGASFSAPVQVSDTIATQGSVPKEGTGGTINVVWYRFGGDFGDVPGDSIEFDRCPANCNTSDGWSTDITVAPVVEIPSPLPGWDFRTNSFPSMDLNRSSGDIYVVFASDPASDDAADVFFTKFTVGGDSWSAPVKLNDDTETDAHQFFPWLAVGPDGQINVVWYDTRAVGEGATNAEINLFFTFSTDGGAHWGSDGDNGPNVRVSAEGFVPNADDQFGGKFIGDYNGLAASPDTAHPLWTGYRGQDQDIFYATVSTAADTTPPVLVSATVDGISLVLAYDEALDTGSVPVIGDFSIDTDGAAVLNAVGVSGTDVTLTLSPGVASVDTVTVSYTAGADPIQDTAGNDATNLVNELVTNSTPAPDTTPPVLVSATVDGISLVLAYDEALDTGSVPVIGDFSIDTDGAAVLNAVGVRGTDVTLTLSPGVASGDTVTVSYTAGADPIQDIAENVAANLVDQGVVNSTPAAGTGTVQGRVKNANTGQKIPGATVMVDPVGPSTTTNNGGKYTLDGAPAGTQDITASAQGCTSQTVTVEVVANDAVKQDFELDC